MQEREKRDLRREIRRAGWSQRDAKHRVGGEMTSLRVPEDLQLFVPKVGTYRFDILPYEVGEGNPYARKGEWYCERTYFVHTRIGPNNQVFVCPLKTVNLPCPICEFRSKLAREAEGEEVLIRELRAKERQLFLIRLRSGRGESFESKNLYLYETSYHTFGRLLDRRRQDAEDDESYIIEFDDPSAGSTLKVSYSEEDAGGYTYINAYAIEFVPRPNGLEPELLQHGYCLDDFVVIYPYDKLKEIFLQVDYSKERQQPVQEEVKKVEKGFVETVEPKGLSERMSVRHRKYGICTILRVSKDGKHVTLEDAQGNVVPWVPVGEVREITQQEQEISEPEKRKVVIEEEESEQEEEQIFELAREKEKPRSQQRTRSQPQQRSRSQLSVPEPKQDLESDEWD